MKVLLFEIITKGRNILLGSIYRPPNTNVKAFNKEINSIMGKIKLETHNDVVIGLDHNLDFLKSEKHTETANFIGSVLDNSLLPCITRSTWVSNNSATLIDNILVSCNLHTIQRSAIIVHDISDHFPSLTILDGVNQNKRERQKIKKHILDDCTVNAIKSDLLAIDWTNLFNKQVLDADYNTFIKIFIDKLEEHVSLKEMVINDKQYLCEPWMTKGLHKCQKKQLRLYEKSLKSGNTEQVIKYKKYKTLLQKITRNSK